MLGFFLRRLAAWAGLLLVAWLVLTALVRLAPDAPATLAGSNAGNDQVDQIRVALGLDRSWPEQVLRGLVQRVSGDFGQSLQDKTPVAPLLAQRIAPSASVAVLALLLAGAVAWPAGLRAAGQPRSAFARWVHDLGSASAAMPAWLVALALFALVLLAGGAAAPQPAVWRPPGEGVGGWLRQVVPPALALALVLAPPLARAVQDTLTTELATPWAATARALGLNRRRLLMRHALPNAAPVLARASGRHVAALVAALVGVEAAFGLPGLGQLAAQAAARRDWPVFEGATLALAVAAAGAALLLEWTGAIVGRPFLPRRARRDDRTEDVA